MFMKPPERARRNPQTQRNPHNPKKPPQPRETPTTPRCFTGYRLGSGCSAWGCHSRPRGLLSDGLPAQPGSPWGGRSARTAAGPPIRADQARGPLPPRRPRPAAAPRPVPSADPLPSPPQPRSLATATPRAPLNAPEPRCHGRSPSGQPPPPRPLRPPGPLRPRPHVPAPSEPPPGPARAPGPPRRPSPVPRSRAGAGRSRPSSSGRRTGPAAATPPPSSLPAGPAPRARRGADGGRGGTRDSAWRKRGGGKGRRGRS